MLPCSVGDFNEIANPKLAIALSLYLFREQRPGLILPLRPSPLSRCLYEKKSPVTLLWSQLLAECYASIPVISHK